MRHRYGALELDLGGQVVFVDQTGRTPIFHRPHGHPNGAGGLALATRCGVELGTGSLIRGAWLNANHAVRFGRPCATCWPELRGQPSLFSHRPRPRPGPPPALA